MKNLGLMQRNVDGPLFEHLEPRKLLSVSYTSQSIPGNADWDVVLEDFDGDGDIDFANAGDDFLRVRLNTGSGQFGTPSDYSIPMTGFVKTFATGDFNGDGYIDIVIGSSSNNGIFVPGNGDGTFGTATFATGIWDAESMWVTDFSGDSIDDIIVDRGNGSFRLFQSDGDGTFTQTAIHSFGLQSAQPLGLADFNGDNVADFAAYGTGSFRIWLGGGGDFTPGPSSLIDAKPAVGDFNGDGLADLVWIPPSSGWQARLSINPGDGRFDSSSVVATPPEFQTLSRAQAIDFDGDGNLDLGFWSSHQVVRASSIYFMYRGNGNGVFETEAELFRLPYSSETSISATRWADTSSDGSPDAFIFTSHITNGVSMLSHSFRSHTNPPTIGSVSGPNDPVTPGMLLTITASNVEADLSRTISTVSLFIDTNKNGTYDNDPSGNGPDTLIRFATPVSGTPNRWTMFSFVLDGQYLGATRFFVVATDSSGASSDATSLDVNFWTRIYFPEGWRNDDTTTEILSLLNASGPKANYRVIARYETGMRDEIIAQGQLGWVSKTQITLVQRGNPASALVRGHVGYAIEVQSDSFISASLLREENFGLAGTANRVTVAESLNSQAASRWGFADVSTRTHDFLVFYNPVEKDVALTITFTHETLGSHVIWSSLGAFRRGGLSLRDIAALAPDEDYSVEIVSSRPIAVAMSRYVDSGGTGFSTVGQLPGNTKSFSGLGFAAGESSELALFNPGNSAINVSIRIIFDDPSATINAQVVSIAAGSRDVLDLTSLAPLAATLADIVVTSSDSFYAHATHSSSTQWGNGQPHSPNMKAQKWEFANAFYKRETNDEWLVITNTSALQSNVSLVFVVNGERLGRSFTIGGSQTIRINLSEEPLLRNGPDLLSFGMLLSGTRELSASLVHWDPVTNVGWHVAGTVDGPFRLL